MAAGSTYTPIATYTIPSTTASYTFSSIPQTYTDLVVVVVPATTGNTYPYFRFNGDATNKYSDSQISGDGSSTRGGKRTAQSRGYIAEWVMTNTTPTSNIVTHIMNYSNSTTMKTYLARNNNTVSGTYVGTELIAGLWASTAAINSITIGTASGGVDSNLAAGTIVSIYGIASA